MYSRGVKFELRGEEVSSLMLYSLPLQKLPYLSSSIMMLDRLSCTFSLNFTPLSSSAQVSLPAAGV